MKNRRYLLSLVLFVLVFMGQAKAVMSGNVPSPLAADEEEPGAEESEIAAPVALVNGDSLFASLTEAFYFATDSTDTNIQLVEDASMGLIVIQEGVTVSLDLNGHQVNIDSLGIYNYGTLVIADKSEGGTGTMTLDHGNVGMIYNYGELTIEGGQYLCTSDEVSALDYRRCMITFENSKTHIKSGRFASNGQALCFYGEGVIDDGEFVSSDNIAVVANYSVDKQLIINGGTFSNLAETPSDVDKRYCLLTYAGTETLIKDGTFTSEGQTLFMLGSVTIDGGNFTSLSNGFVVGNYCTEGELLINGGTFQNLSPKPEADEDDHRTCLYSNNNTKTTIANAMFDSPCQVLVFNGDAVVNSGKFVTKGNTNVVGNYNTTGELVINGGTFNNEGTLPEDSEETDNHRCLWGSMGTTTIINDGTFSNNSTAQTITIYGKATINGATITNSGHGSGISSNGSVEISGCKICAWNMLICWEGATMTCSGGLFSEPIPEELLAEGCQCVDNTDPSTMETYPYKVIKGVPGDVNGDGAVNVADISTVISVMSGTESEETEKAADVNGDGNVDVADISTIISIMAGE